MCKAGFEVKKTIQYKEYERVTSVCGCFCRKVTYPFTDYATEDQP
jgi:hypothetical protein